MTSVWISVESFHIIGQAGQLKVSCSLLRYCVSAELFTRRQSPPSIATNSSSQGIKPLNSFPKVCLDSKEPKLFLQSVEIGLFYNCIDADVEDLTDDAP